MDIGISNVDFAMVALSVLAYAVGATVWTYLVVPPAELRTLPALGFNHQRTRKEIVARTTTQAYEQPTKALEQLLPET